MTMTMPILVLPRHLCLLQSAFRAASDDVDLKLSHLPHSDSPVSPLPCLSSSQTPPMLSLALSNLPHYLGRASTGVLHHSTTVFRVVTPRNRHPSAIPSPLTALHYRPRRYGGPTSAILIFPPLYPSGRTKVQRIKHTCTNIINSFIHVYPSCCTFQSYIIAALQIVVVTHYTPCIIVVQCNTRRHIARSIATLLPPQYATPRSTTKMSIYKLTLSWCSPVV
jgi:hypothetical protein